ncbi:hybrid sensor histidine kinase/response regulator [Leptolyngbya sp. AN02str]|uniref:hybrid sensor histidine kinase/response regulator n=1 Tax=Leptolyngbya sp. AN02str TaxID=3423363 RepID=UPI003D311648
MISDAADSSKGNILIVDDSPDNLRILSTNLTSRGYKVRCVTNGNMALVSLKYLLPDLILLDIRMPITDGYEVCRRLKADPVTQPIPIIFISAADDVAVKVKAFAVGGVDYITKPFHFEEVLARVAHQLTIRQLQSQLLEQNHNLQQEIAQHKQTQTALEDARAAAESANYAKSEFLAKMSHELRTPLNAILGFSGLMEHDQFLSEEHRDYVLMIHQAAQRLLKLLNHILSVTSHEAGQLALQERKFDLHGFLAAIASAWQPKARAKGLNFALDYVTTTLPQWIFGDDGKLRQVLGNLLENAVQFTYSGSITLRVRVEVSHESSLTWPGGDGSKGDRLLPLLFEVEDTGSGIAATEVDRLFQAFSQAGSGLKSEQGVGLGLFISRQFVQAMGGDITISCTSGSGTVARFYVLMQSVECDAPDAVIASCPLAAQSYLGGGSDRPQEDAGWALPTPTLTLTEERMLEALHAEMGVRWLSQLHRAAIQGCEAQISQLIEAIPAPHLGFAQVLAEWNQNFQFDQIVAIAQQALERSLKAHEPFTRRSLDWPVEFEPLITSDSFRGISQDWILQLHQAAILGRDRHILHLIDQLPNSHSALGQTLKKWVKEFRFENIIELTVAIGCA